MDPKKGCSVNLVAAEEGSCSISNTQRPSYQGRLHAEHELDAASSIRNLPPSSIAPSPKGFEHKIREEKHKMNRKNPRTKEVRSGCTVSSQLTWSSTQKSAGTKEFVTTDSMMDGFSVLPETQFVRTSLCVDTRQDSSVRCSLPLRELPERGKSLTSTPVRLPSKSKATRSQQVDFAYDQVASPHRSYRPSGGHPWGKQRTSYMWICLQLSRARGMDNGDVMATYTGSEQLPSLYTYTGCEQPPSLYIYTGCEHPSPLYMYTGCEYTAVIH